jgi:hypothetical protein
MAEVKITSQTYKLRAGSPMAVGLHKFVLQSFMAERTLVDNYLYTENLKGSEEFRGQGGQYMSANFTRLLDSGSDSFSGSVTHEPDFVDENYAD